MQKLRVKPIQMGPYSRGITLPAWWFKLNEDPKELEIEVTADSIEVRPRANERTDNITEQSISAATIR